MRGRFVSLEGLEGVGKTTNLAGVQALLQVAGHDVLVTREPGGTPFAEHLRSLVLHGDHAMQAGSELLLIAAARLEHVTTVIEPALADGRWVLSDRYLDASVAYQGGGRQLGVDRVVTLHELMDVRLQPDLTILLDMPIEAALARMAKRGAPDRIEREGLEFFERARAAYLQRAAADPTRVQVIDADQPLANVQGDVAAAVATFLGKQS